MPDNLNVKNLNPLDATFLAMQTETAPVHVGALLIYDKPKINSDEQINFDSLALLKTLLEEKLLKVDKFTFRLIRFPFDIFHPIWIKDLNFNINNHIKTVSLEAPYNDAKLNQLIGTIWESPLPENKPLWEFYLVENYLNDRIAVIAKVHHSLIDGVSGSNLFVQLLDLDAEIKVKPTTDSAINNKIAPTTTVYDHISQTIAYGPKIVSNILSNQVRYFSQLPTNAKKVSSSMNLLVKFYRSDAKSKPPLLFMAPKTPLNKPVSDSRSFSFKVFNIEEISQIKNHYGVKINDVIMTICSNALRNYLLKYSELPDSPLTAMMPISIRDESQKEMVDNQVSAAVVYLPTNESDIITQLKVVSANAQNSKNLSSTIGETIFMDVAALLPINIQQVLARSVYRLISSDKINPPANVIITNVPGPPFPLYSNSIPLENVIPIGALGEGLGLCFAIFSYNKYISISILSDPKMEIDIDCITDNLGSSFEALLNSVNVKVISNQAIKQTKPISTSKMHKQVSKTKS